MLFCVEARVWASVRENLECHAFRDGALLLRSYSWAKRSRGGLRNDDSPLRLASLGRPPVPADLPASSLNTGYTPSRLACCGVFVSFKHPPLREGLRGYRHKPLMTTGIRDGSDSDLMRKQYLCQLYRIRNPQILSGFPLMPTLDILDRFWTMSKCSIVFKM